jgi:HEPN domain-containing protein
MLLEDGDFQLAGFCLQQAMEKLLKGFLLSRGWQLRKIHNLDALLDDAVEHDPALEAERKALQRITAFYTAERYPLVEDLGITEKDVGALLDQVTPLFERLRRQIIP